MADHFAFRELRIRQPGKVLPGRARYEIFDPDKHLLAVAAETESRGVLNTMIGLVGSILFRNARAFTSLDAVAYPQNS